MKKISEMSLEELQDYALQLEGEKKGFEDKATQDKTRIDELVDLNTKLQKRNNDLLMKVEQQPTADEGKPAEPEKVQTCEEFARTIKI